MLMNIVSSLKVGIVGTGYAAQKRAEAIKADRRTELVAVTGNTPEQIADFCQTFNIQRVDSWVRLVDMTELDLIFVCTINRDCGAIALAAIGAGKHVVVEYPLALEAKLAAQIIELATAKEKLLHVEHMEIIGGLHQAIKQYLPHIGRVFYARYATISAQKSDRYSWKYNKDTFGFPLAAALSRIHRLTDLFGRVESVNCRNRYWEEVGSHYFTACMCNARLNFENGIVAEVIYGKGDVFHHSDRTLEIYGEEGTILFEGEKGKLIKNKIATEIPVTSRRGLFAKDTAMVLDYLFDGQPLYIQPQASLYALEIANAAQKSSFQNKIVNL
ncbi:Gfo/Idh/MocA family oxidoreductase [Waterburya agarophytonicola K14]|uniref:Gfo/Idh/MocA family oxidoreductase n=1 Tax=Waterburya agarophytonicola KI4 TaxID=2874699 RepID=A0A964BMV8_9CYAN|nr:Gfo/Idh/MocA family oxidoreductase [Waterburya agarophytonicola]MCC0175642.1 Gfo/Idh/MocA family oxidoreductase [Waterburya agarophytonicola KI4]